MQDEWLYRLALIRLPGVGAVTARQLLRYGSPKDIFTMSKKELATIEGIGEKLVRQIIQNKNTSLQEARQELLRLETLPDIKLLWIDDVNFPYRLRNCYDSPLALYYTGNADLNCDKTVSIIGTRNATPRGLETCRELIESLTNNSILIISGLAHGIDSCAHKSAIAGNLPTIGVLGHGPDHVYPASNKDLAVKMMKNGGILTEYPLGTWAEACNFPMRNRIVAGMSDAVIVIESDIKGGSMITADLADSYNRNIFAFPGRTNDKYSKGCNYLIKTRKAEMIENADDFLKQMHWDIKQRNDVTQLKLFDNIEPDVAIIIEHLRKGTLSKDELSYATNLASGTLAMHLLNLEIRGAVKSVPGNRYTLNH